MRKISGYTGCTFHELKYNIKYIKYSHTQSSVYDYIIYILYYILAYIQHNGDVSLEKKTHFITH